MSRHSSPQPRSGARFALAALGALFNGRLFLRNGYRPPQGHRVPPDFAGFGVAAHADAAHDPALLDRISELGVRQLRIDFTYGDADAATGRLLHCLAEAGHDITLHLIQPFSEAKRMPDGDAGEAWRKFLRESMDRFGAMASTIEVTSTVNRKRWAGYTLDGLLAAWEIAHEEVRRAGLTLAGPSITDFEPVYNAGLLALLRERGQLPDIHVDNLFSERCTEPERWDHKVLGNFLAPLIRFNLIKKARILAGLGANEKVPRLRSPAAFWTLPRIARQLPDAEQKQADYLARYFVLCAASGALERAYWGPLVCHREGLIDDDDREYPALERITHYASYKGEELRLRPAFHALSTFNHLIPGCTYEGRLSSGDGLEIHAFSDARHQLHVVWTADGLAAALPDLYDVATLGAARIYDRDGDELTGSAILETDLATLTITERPVYLRWSSLTPIPVAASAAVLPGVAVHAHRAGLRHYYYRSDEWHGMVCAADGPEADRLIAALQPEHIGEPDKLGILRHARNAIWTVADPRNPDRKLAVKRPVKHHFHKKLLDRLKPSKARRSWSGACELMRRGLATAPPVAWFEQRSGRDLTQNWFVCEYVEGQVSVSSLFSAYARKDAAPPIEPAIAYAALAEYLLRMHARGIFFRDLSGGNILIGQSEEEPRALKFSLIDTARIRVYRRGVPIRQRLADLARALHKLHPEGRDAFMHLYLKGMGRSFTPFQRLGFQLYDFKAALKRRLRKTALYKKLKR